MLLQEIKLFRLDQLISKEVLGMTSELGENGWFCQAFSAVGTRLGK